jgi:hypothetical protein
MIVSHKYKFIFIKTVKTAGTSIEVDLKKVLGETDIATPIYPAVEGHKAQNHVVKNKFFGSTEYRNHMTAREVRKVVGNPIWDDYFKFCVEREPVSKVISHYSMLVKSPYHNQKTKDLSFDDYMDRRKFPIDTAKYTDKNGLLIVDKILKYEDLDKDLIAVASQLGFNMKLSTKAKSGLRLDLQISKEHSEIIYEAFSSSNRFTGYSLML